MLQDLENLTFFKEPSDFFFTCLKWHRGTRAVGFTRGLAPPNHRDAFKNLTSSSQPLALPPGCSKCKFFPSEGRAHPCEAKKAPPGTCFHNNLPDCFSLSCDCGYKWKHSLDVLCSDISTLPLQMFSLLTGADPITLYRVQLPCPTSGGQFPAFESRQCKPGGGNLEILFVHPCTQRAGECVKDNLSPVNVESSGCLVARITS